jgi:NAD(P)-dependent dehydrogenase (short-subunit alcohol dehydrogenase family)
MQHKTIVITGGNDGIGYETAKTLASKNANIIILSRNEQKAKQAIEKIIKETGNANVQYVIADLLSLKSVRQAAAQIINSTEKIDVLINNAGATFSKFELSEDGLEKTMATNHFSHFLLTGLLLNSKKLAQDARIINVSSHSHYSAPAKGINFNSLKTNQGYFIMSAYEQSKLANVIFTISLAEKLKSTQITVNSLHPGAIKTHIGNKPDMNWFHSLAWSVLQKTIALSIEEGARTSIYLATSDEVKNISGKYFSSTSRFNRPFAKTQIVPHHKMADDKNQQEKLWQLSETYCDIQYQL